VVEFGLGWATGTGAEFDEVRADREEGYEWLATAMRTGIGRWKCSLCCGARDGSGQSAFLIC
jgi:hypothetical protein